MKKRMREVMRYAGPRMIFFHPITTIKHFIQNKQNGQSTIL